MKLQAYNFNKKETLAQLLSCEFREILKNTFFTEHLQATASIFWKMFLAFMPHFLEQKAPLSKILKGFEKD